MASDIIKAALAAGKTALDEWESKSLFAAYGIPVPEGALVKGETEAVAAAAGIGGQVVMKGVASEIHHKTEAGLVVLGVDADDADAVGRTYRLLEERAAGALEAVLVERMIAANRELMVGMKRDHACSARWWPSVWAACSPRRWETWLWPSLPSTIATPRSFPALIKAKRLLGSFRGYPPVDRAALSKILQAIGQMALDHPEIAEIDVNPLMVEGDRPVAADALIILSGASLFGAGAEAPFVPNIKALVAPRSMAVVGASGDVNKWGGSALRSIIDGGYSGTLYPVNPKGGEFFGLKAYTSIEELPGGSRPGLAGRRRSSDRSHARAVRPQGYPCGDRHCGRLLGDR